MLLLKEYGTVYLLMLGLALISLGKIDVSLPSLITFSIAVRHRYFHSSECFLPYKVM